MKGDGPIGYQLYKLSKTVNFLKHKMPRQYTDRTADSAMGMDVDMAIDIDLLPEVRT